MKNAPHHHHNSPGRLSVFKVTRLSKKQYMLSARAKRPRWPYIVAKEHASDKYLRSSLVA